MKFYGSAFLFISLFSYSSQLQAQSSNPVPYDQEIASFRNARVTSLKAENGWLNLAGLYWLEPGNNTFGTGTGNQIVFPEKTIAENAGSFELKDNTVWIHAASGANITINGEKITDKQIFETTPGYKAPVMACGSLRFNIIRRDNKFGIRLRDLNSESVKNFHGIPVYNTDTSWRVKAFVKKPAPGTTIGIKNVLGQTIQHPLVGTVSFEKNGTSFSLDAITEGGNTLFIIFADATNIEGTTYPAGRFLYAPFPDENGYTFLDFNKAQNPPCAFTPYATCPLPPRQNKLPVAVMAGEKFDAENH